MEPWDLVLKKLSLWGVARGLFSNEAGMGSTPHAHATAVVEHPVEQDYTDMVGVFIDTMVVCTATALIILQQSQMNLVLMEPLLPKRPLN